MTRPELVDQLAELSQDELLATLNQALARNAADQGKGKQGRDEARKRFGSTTNDGRQRR